MANSKQYTGSVKFYNGEKAYGFLSCKELSKDIFVHASGLIDRIEKDDVVTFNTTEGKKGLQAVNVQLSK